MRIIIELDGREAATTTVQVYASPTTFSQISVTPTAPTSPAAPTEALTSPATLGARNRGAAPSGLAALGIPAALLPPASVDTVVTKSGDMTVVAALRAADLGAAPPEIRGSDAPNYASEISTASPERLMAAAGLGAVDRGAAPTGEGV